MELRTYATAIVDGEQRLSYRQLWAQAVALAEGLIELGVQRETLVGMAPERSARAIVTMIGIVLAGGAYVPINPEYPARRIAQIVNLSGLRLLLCSAQVRADMAASLPAEIDVRDVDEVARPRPVDAGGFMTPPAAPDRSPLAYVIYTSGSTGQPKGVMIEHRGVLRLVKDTGYFDFTAQHRFLQSSSLEFDAATFEVWGALLNGGTLYVADKDTAVVPSRYRQALREHGITVAWLTAPLFHQIVDDDPGAFAPLRVLLTGGDVVSPDHVNRVREHNPGLAVHNCYGPTENTTFTTVHPVQNHLAGAVPIGTPIPGTTVLVCDERGRPVPTGTVGELLVGGAGLARGYLNQPELTDRRFVLVEGERLYRTGDRARIGGDDGLLHFHGRVDDQVKIRGNLVELIEVNAALLAVRGVRDAYTRSVGETGETRRLVAYVVADGVSDDAIRTALRAELPRYMCPEQLVRLDRLPLNRNGKVDWRVLQTGPRPSGRGPVWLTAEQQRLAGLWAQLLGVDERSVAPGDSFIDLGGDSMQLGMLLGRISRRLGVRLSFAEASAADTLEAMSKAVDAAAAEPMSAIRPVPAGHPVALHPQQRRLYAIWQADPESVAYNVPFRITISGPLDREQLRSAVRTAVERHDAFRMRFLLGEHGAAQQAIAGLEPVVEYHEGPVEQVLPAFVRPFRLDEPPALRALLVHTGPDRHELYLDVHHIVFDGESLRLTVEDVFDRYAGIEPPVPLVGYADASQWCHDQLAAGAYATDETYWSASLADPPRLMLPTDRPRGASRPTSAAVTSRVLDVEQCAAIGGAARRHSTTVYVVLLTAYFAVLARLSGQRDLIVGSPVSGRTHPDLDDVIGMFVSTVGMCARLAAGCTFADLISQVDERSRQALSHQNYPFERLVDRLGAAGDPSRDPLLHAFFALHNIAALEFRKAGLDISIELLGTGAIRFELNLQAHQHADRLVLELEYASELFDRVSADYLLDQYTHALFELVDTPHAAACPVQVGGSAASCPDFDF